MGIKIYLRFGAQYRDSRVWRRMRADILGNGERFRERFESIERSTGFQWRELEKEFAFPRETFREQECEHQNGRRREKSKPPAGKQLSRVLNGGPGEQSENRHEQKVIMWPKEKSRNDGKQGK